MTVQYIYKKTGDSGEIKVTKEKEGATPHGGPLTGYQRAGLATQRCRATRESTEVAGKNDQLETQVEEEERPKDWTGAASSQLETHRRG